jgi:uncharacterized protein YjbI with pentapeptide repeats
LTCSDRFLEEEYLQKRGRKRKMADQKQELRLQSGIFTWNQWRQHTSKQRPDLSHADLSHSFLCGGYFWDTDLSFADLSDTNLEAALLTRADLSHADLSHAKLQQADLRNTRLWRANLWGADLSFARLQYADLACADLRGADLHGADLEHADLRGADLSGSILTDTHFQGTHLGGTIFAAVDLSGVHGLIQAIHESASTVDIKTVTLPQGKTLPRFLRETGFSDLFIDALPSLLPLSHQYRSCFISYAHPDGALARRLHADLQDQGVRCWFAPQDLRVGDKIRPSIDDAIHHQDTVLLMLSKHSVASQWVEQEVETALEKERKENSTVLFPIRLDNTVMEIERGWPLLIRTTRHIGDFTNWKLYDTYQIAFHRLLHDLKIEE